MLQIARRFTQLSFGQLMQVYAQSNIVKAGEEYPQLSTERGVAEVEQDFCQYLRQVFFRTPGAFYAVWQVDGSYVSALRLEPYMDGWLIEGLQTHRNEREKGYAKALLRAVLEELGQGKVYAHIHGKNLPSIKVHAACGFQKISDVCRYIDGSVDRRCQTYQLQIGREL